MAFKCETVLRRGVVLQIPSVICVKRYADLSIRDRIFQPFLFFFTMYLDNGYERKSRQDHCTISLAELLPVDRAVPGCRDLDGAGAKLPWERGFTLSPFVFSSQN